MTELENLPVTSLIALGFSTSQLGSSGTLLRNVSKWFLNVSAEQLVLFLSPAGRELKRRGPFTWKDPSLIDFVLLEQELLTGWMLAIRPLRAE